jgi:hypothetical protein
VVGFPLIPVVAYLLKDTPLALAESVKSVKLYGIFETRLVLVRCLELRLHWPIWKEGWCLASEALPVAFIYLRGNKNRMEESTKGGCSDA